MKKIIVSILVLSCVFMNNFIIISATNDYHIDNETIEYFNNYYNSSYKFAELNDIDVTQEFLDRTVHLYKEKDYDKIYTIFAEGYTLCYDETSPKTRAFEQVLHNFHIRGVSKAPAKYGDSVCSWGVSFLCKFSVNSNTGAIASVSDPTLSLEYGETSNIQNATTFLASQSAYVSKKGSNYVDFGYKFNINVRGLFSGSMGHTTVTYTTQSGVKRLYIDGKVVENYYDKY